MTKLLLGRDFDHVRGILSYIANEKQKKSPYYSILSLDSSVEAFAHYIIETLQLNGNDIERLTKLNGICAKNAFRFRFTIIAGTLVAICTFLLTIIPEELFRRNGWDFGTFQIRFFLTTLILFFLAAMISTIILSNYSRARRLNSYCDIVLTYCEHVLRIKTKRPRKNHPKVVQSG